MNLNISYNWLSIMRFEFYIVAGFLLFILIIALFLYVIFKRINSNKGIIIKPTEFPLLDQEKILFVSSKMRSVKKLLARNLYDVNGSFIIITDKRIVISCGPSWMKYSLFFSRDYFDKTIDNTLLIDKFKYNSSITIFEKFEDNGDNIEITCSGLGSEIKFMRKFSNILGAEMIFKLWDYKIEDKKVIIDQILKYNTSVKL